MSVILDSGFICAYRNMQDKNHDTAIQIVGEIDRDIFGTMYISDYLFDETLTLLRTRIGIDEARKTGNIILQTLHFIKIDDLIFEDALKKFQKYNVSFTDCTTLSLMKYIGIEYLATFDGDFKGLVKTLGV